MFWWGILPQWSADPASGMSPLRFRNVQQIYIERDLRVLAINGGWWRNPDTVPLRAWNHAEREGQGSSLTQPAGKELEEANKHKSYLLPHSRRTLTGGGWLDEPSNPSRVFSWRELAKALHLTLPRQDTWDTNVSSRNRAEGDLLLGEWRYCWRLVGIPLSAPEKGLRGIFCLEEENKGQWQRHRVTAAAERAGSGL